LVLGGDRIDSMGFAFLFFSSLFSFCFFCKYVFPYCLLWGDQHRKLKFCALADCVFSNFLHFWQCWQQGQTVHVVCTDVVLWKAKR
jgi:hypothetical protein